MSIETIFAAAAQKPATERAEYLADACGNDAELRRKIERLLSAHDAAGEFLESPANRDTNTLDYQPIAEKIGTRIGPYKLMEQIGEGGFGLVFVADQTEPVKRKVALKIIKPGMDSAQVIARFAAEQQALALMDHPNIARVLDAGATESGRSYFVMELVRGIPITEYCDKNQLSPKERLELFVTVCQAIQHAHQKGIIHRDIKPSNVLVTSHDGKPVAKVIDFGVAKAIHQQLTDRTVYTNFAQMVGTPLYMSPEQAEMSGLDIDTRSDIYSLGVLLYELLTGTTPIDKKRFARAAYDEIRRMIREEDPPKPSTRLSTTESIASVAARRHTEPAKLSKLMRGDLDWITMKCLEKDRTRRYETANGLARDVQRYLNDEAVEACPPSAGYRLHKFVRRNRRQVLAGSLVLLALLVGIAGTTWGMIRAERAESRAIVDRDAAVHARREALEALNDLTDNAVAQLMARQQSLAADEQEFLQRIVARFDRLAGALAGESEAAELRARCLSQVGLIYNTLGNHSRAVEAYQQAADSYRTLRDREPNQPLLAYRLIGSLNNWGVSLERLGRRADCARCLNEAFALAKQAHEQFPENDDIAIVLSLMWDNQANQQWTDQDARLAAANQAIGLAQTVFSRSRANANSAIRLALSIARRAEHFGDVGDVRAAQADLDRVEQLKEGAGSRGHEIEYGISKCRLALARALLNSNQPDAAVATARQAASTFETLSFHFPGNAEHTRYLIDAYRTAERACRQCGRYADADAFLTRATALAEKTVGAAGRENALTLGDMIDLTAAQCRNHYAAGRRADGISCVEKLIGAGRRLLAVHAGPGKAMTPDARTDCLRQAHRFWQIADLSCRLGYWSDSIDFARNQIEFARASLPPGEKPNAEVAELLKSGHWCLTNCFRELGRLKEARSHWEELLLLTAWINPSTSNVEVCEHINAFAGVLMAAGQPANPSEVLAPGFVERQAKLTASPRDPDSRIELLRGYRVLGLILEKGGKFEEALVAFDKGIALEAESTDGEKELHRQCLLGRAVCLDLIDREAEADAAWNALIEFAGKNSTLWLLDFRMIKLFKGNRAIRSIRIAEELLRNPSSTDGHRYNAACAFARASATDELPAERKENLAIRAVALLGEAKSMGLFTDPNQRQNVKNDSDLDPLRGREDFRRFLAELELPAQPTTKK